MADSLDRLSITEKSKLQQIARMCSQVFIIMNKLKTVQEEVNKLDQNIQNYYMALECCFIAFLGTFLDIYFI